MYLNYFIHGVGCSILGQAVIKEALAASWGVEVMAITAISAALGLGRLIALPFAGPLSDKLGRRISTAIGSGSYAIYLIGLALAFNAGTNGGYHDRLYLCNRRWYRKLLPGYRNLPGSCRDHLQSTGRCNYGNQILHFCIAQMLLTVRTWVQLSLQQQQELTSYNTLFYACGIAYLVLLVLVMLFPLPDADQKAAGKKEGLIDSLKHTHFSVESIAMILIGFTCTGTFQLWLELCTELCKRECWLG